MSQHEVDKWKEKMTRVENLANATMNKSTDTPCDPFCAP